MTARENIVKTGKLINAIFINFETSSSSARDLFFTAPGPVCGRNRQSD